MALLKGKQIGSGEIANTNMAANSIDSDQYVDGSIDGAHISANGKQTVLDSKYSKFFNAVSNFSTTNASSDYVSQEVIPLLTTMASGGSSSVKGAVTSSPHNKVSLKDSTTNDPLQNSSSQQVYGRMTFSEASQTGTDVTFNGTISVVGTATAFLTDFSAGDYIKGPDGSWNLINSVIDDTNIQLNSAGPTGATGAAPVKITFTLNYYVDNAGSETAHTMAGTETIDFFFPESMSLYDADFGAFANGIDAAQAESLPADHAHDDKYYRESELADSAGGDDGASLIGYDSGSNAHTSATNVANALDDMAGAITTAGGNHDDRYYTETEIGSSTASDGASLVGYDATSNAYTSATNVANALDDLATAIGAVGGNKYVDAFTAEAVVKGNAFVQTLANAPAVVAETDMYVNGIRQKYGASDDFTISGQTVTWTSNADFDIDTGDEVVFVYEY